MSQAGTHPAHRNDIDGLRAIAVTSVLFYHADSAWLPGGFVGVDVFFVISGYLISGIIFGGIARGTFSFADFYARRVKRIFPALWLVLLCVIAFGWVALFTDEYQRLGKHVAAGAVFLSNIVLWREAGYFDPAADLKPLLQLWSLGVEEQFYLIWPLIFVLLAKARRSPLAAIGVITLGSFALNVYWVRDHEVRSFYLPITRFWELSIGSLLAYGQVFGIQRTGTAIGRLSVFLSGGASSAMRNSLAVAGLGLLGAALILLSKDDVFPGWLAALPTIGTFLLIAAGNRSWVNSRLLGNPMMVWVGLISYPLYLWHWPLLSFLRILSPSRPSGGLTLLALAVAVGLAWLTYRFVEQPIRTNRLRLRPSLALVAGVACVGAMGLSAFLGQFAPRSASFGLEKIIAATDAVAFPGPNLLQLSDGQTTVWGQGQGNSTVLLLGDSEMEQYYPRIDHLLTRHAPETRRIIYSTHGGCAPIPFVRENHLPWCNGLVDLDLKLAADPAIDTIVIAADWTGYFIGGPPPNPWTYYYEHDGTRGNLTGHMGSKATDEALAGFERMVARFRAMHKTVFIVLPSPTGHPFSPRRMIERSLSDLSFRIQPPFISAPELISRISPIVDRLREIGARTGAHLIDPIATLCGPAQCPLTTEDGLPIYKDDAHLNPLFVRDDVHYLDDIFMLDRAGTTTENAGEVVAGGGFP
jgi:peptidoglycan/LPS O-acetylase OafA/YrhL